MSGGAGVQHGADPQGDLVEEMRLQCARHLVEQNSNWWTHHPEPALFLEMHQLARLKALVTEEEGFKYRVGNEVQLFVLAQ